jgi:hypothetical protein
MVLWKYYKLNGIYHNTTVTELVLGVAEYAMYL